MNKIFIFTAALFLSSCASNDLSLLAACTYSNGKVAPVWTCNSSAALDYDNLKNVAWATGEAKALPAGRSLQQKVAVLDGRAKLMERIQVRVKSLLQKQVEGSRADNDIKLFVESFSEGTLKGSRTYTRAIDSGDGHMYVIVGIGDGQFKKNIEANDRYQALLDKIKQDKAAGGAKAAKAIEADLADISSVVLR